MKQLIVVLALLGILLVSGCTSTNTENIEETKEESQCWLCEEYEYDKLGIDCGWVERNTTFEEFVSEFNGDKTSRSYRKAVNLCRDGSCKISVRECPEDFKLSEIIEEYELVKRRLEG